MPDTIESARAADAVEPWRSEREARIAALWTELLDLSVISAEDDFFHLGGDSLAAEVLMTAIGRDFGVDLPVSTIARASTVRALAAAIERAAPAHRPDEIAVAMQPAGDRPPFFLVHGVNGLLLFAEFLAAVIGRDQPLYALSAGALHDRGRLVPDIPRIAAAYVAEIRRIQPAGPYHLGGYCAGGIIALEMARQLRREGGRIGSLVLIDPPEKRSGRVWRGQLLAGGAALLALKGVRKRLRLFGVDLDQARLQRAATTSELLLRAMISHRAQPYAGSFTLLASEERMERLARPGSYLRGLSYRALLLCVLGPDHETLFTRHAADIARILRLAVDGADLLRADLPGVARRQLPPAFWRWPLHWFGPGPSGRI